MKTRIVLNPTGLPDEVEVEVRSDQLIIWRVRTTRSGWAEAFACMAAASDDQLLDTQPH